MTKKTKTVWTKPLMKIYQKYPAAFRSKDWADIVQMANSDDVQGAVELAQAHEDSHKSIRAHNVIARRIRIQRVKLMQIQAAHLARIRAAFDLAGQTIGHRMIHLPNTVSALAPMRVTTRAVVVLLRRTLKTILTDLIWQSILLGVKNMGEAIKPILRDNSEMFHVELAEIALLEDRLTIGVSKKLASKTKGTVDLGSDKWQEILDSLYKDMVMTTATGLSLSDRIWDLTARAEMDIKRVLASEIAKGTSSRDIADQLQKHIFTAGVDDVQTGPGIYKSPLANAMRIARTETNRAYTQATAAWADNKPWIKGILITLSPAHDVEDDCDDEVSDQPDDGYSPDEFADHVPVHPHCMCFGTYVIDDTYLTGDKASQPDEEDQ